MPEPLEPRRLGVLSPFDEARATLAPLGEGAPRDHAYRVDRA